MTTVSSGSRRPGRLSRIAVPGMAVLLQVVVLVPFSVASGLLAPLWAVVGFLLMWATFAGLLAILIRRKSVWALAVPFANALALWIGLSLGEALLGWTA